MSSKIMRPHRLVWPRTSDFHSDDRGSNPLGDAIKNKRAAYIKTTVPIIFLIKTNLKISNF